MTELPKTYDPKAVEPEIYRGWEASGYFNPDKLPNSKRRKPFVISMPPPNITGELHMGHALGMTLEDVMIRFRRMQGRAALWLPGTDHAAIATQVVVERELRSHGIDRKKLGREKFLRRVWDWKKQYGGRIVEQIKRIGSSADWSRERFTMDEGLTLAVQTAFKNLYDDGYIYRGERIINWCWECQTAVSDLEVDHKDTPGKLWHLRYPLSDKTGFVIVATTRPETMLGDTAVAVNPSDARYRQLVGKTLRLPLVGRDIPIIADERIDMTFGSGAVKVTPAHDPLDFDIGQTHHLPGVQVIGFDGLMTAEAGGDFSGKTIEDARKFVIEKMQGAGLLEKEEDYIHAVGYCSRSNTAIEPLVSKQWFMKMQSLAKPAIEAVKSGETVIVPKRYTKTFYHWMENIRDWNISRQIWWGHRLPVWYKKSDKDRIDPKVALKSPGPSWMQDEDTLDTWFSSGLWTFSTLGWPKRTADLRRFHPTDVMETGWDILFFWVARMMMFSLYFMKETPFNTIYLHGLVLDAEGRKMSKSKGTGIDPLPIADRYGMDALRMSLLVGNAPGQDFRLFEKKIEGYRNFANKIWNMARFILQTPKTAVRPKATSLADRWIDARRKQVVTQVTRSLERFDFSVAGQTLYDFIWHDLADWYLEATKVQPNPALLYDVFEDALRLLHPFMPFLSERLWQEFQPGSCLMIESWPRTKPAPTPALKAFAELQSTVVAARNFAAHAHARIVGGGFVDDIDENLLSKLVGFPVKRVARLEPASNKKEIVLGNTRFLFDRDLVENYENWREQERQTLTRYQETITKKLANAAFVQNAPASVVEAERQKLAETERRLLEL